MEKLLVMNGKSYKPAKIGNGFLRKLEARKIKLNEVEDSLVSVLTIFVAASMGVSDDEADDEIDTFLENGGEYEYLTDIMSEAMQESGFFRRNKESQEKTTKSGKKKAANEEVTS